MRGDEGRMIEYATDTYQVFNFNGEEVFAQFAMSGRFVTAIIGYIVKTINLSESTIYWGSSILAVIFLVLSIYKMYKLIKPNIRSKFFQILIPILIVVNPFSIELFLFIEKGIMIFGIFMSIYAVEKLVKFFETKQKRNIIYGLIFMFFATCSYQGVVGIFVAISLVYILKYSKTIKEFILNNLIVALVYGIPAIIDYLLVRVIYSTGRVSGEIIIEESINRIFSSTISMIKTTYSLLPEWAFVLCICFISVIVLCDAIKNKMFVKDMLKYFYIIIGTVIIAIVPQFIQSTDSIWFVSRSTYPFASLYGILLFYLFMNYEVKPKEFYALILVSLILLGMQTQTFARIVKDRYILNQMDYEVSMQIIDKISEYESATGEYISKIQIYFDNSPKYTYDGIFATGDINIKAFSTEWSAKAILEYYLGRCLLQEDNLVGFEMLFSEENWDVFDGEQVLFCDDVLILCLF